MVSHRSNRQVTYSNGGSLKRVIDHLHEHGKAGFLATHALESILKLSFQDTQARVHIISGSLKASGHTESDFDGDTWRGTIIYGGPLFGSPAPGPPNDPVDYAIYEMARGGSHDWFSGLPAYEPLYENAIDKIVEESW